MLNLVQVSTNKVIATAHNQEEATQLVDILGSMYGVLRVEIA